MRRPVSALRTACLLALLLMAGGAAANAAIADLAAPLAVVVERDPSRVAAASRLARLYAEARDWEAAARVLERSAPYALNDAAYQGLTGTVLRELKRPRAAAAAYQRAIALAPDDGRWWVGLGLALDDAGDRAEASQAFAAARERELPPVLRRVAERRRR